MLVAAGGLVLNVVKESVDGSPDVLGEVCWTAVRAVEPVLVDCSVGIRYCRVFDVEWIGAEDMPP